MDCSLPGSSIHGILQARIQEWLAISCSRVSSRPRLSNPRLLCFLHQQADSLPLCHLKVQVTSLSRVQLFAAPWTAAHQASPSMGFSRQENWSGLPCPPAVDLPRPGIEPASLMSPAPAGRFFTTSATGKSSDQLLMMYI